MNQFCEHGRRNALHAFFLHRPDPLVPKVGIAQLRRDIGENGAVDALARMDQEPESDHPAERNPDPVDLPEPDRVENSDRIPAKLIQRRGAGGDDARTMAAHIIANDAKMPQQRRHELIEKVQIAAQRMRQHDRGRAFPALNDDVEGFSLDDPFGHASLPNEQSAAASVAFALTE